MTNRKEYSISIVINGNEQQYTRKDFFREIEQRASYPTESAGHFQVDSNTWNAAFSVLGMLRGIDKQTAFHWLHETAAELAELTEGDYEIGDDGMLIDYQNRLIALQSVIIFEEVA